LEEKNQLGINTAVTVKHPYLLQTRVYL